MEHADIVIQMDAVIARHNLLNHPFYQAWTAGRLRAEDLRRYAQEYYHHVAAFPSYLSALHSRLPDGPLRRSVLRNLCEEEISGPAHSDLWLDFAEGMGANREELRSAAPSPGASELIGTFRAITSEQAPAAALGAFYAYESQVGRIAGLKAQSLRDDYGADAKTCAYFVLHATQDAHHSRVWAEWVAKLRNGDHRTEEILATVDRAAVALRKSLDNVSAGMPIACLTVLNQASVG